MQKYWFSLMVFICLAIPSLQVIMMPCKATNIVTEPHYATSLTRRALVQVVQIPPVFTQKVMVGRCVNATSEISMTPGSYFMCKQRYSSVELYVMENVSIPGIAQHYNPNSTIQAIHGILERFKQGHFVREFVVVESGCDFTFNLLPLLFQRNQQQSTTYSNPTTYPAAPAHLPDNEDHHRFLFLKSPYHSTQQSQQQYSTPSAASQQHINPQLVNYEHVPDSHNQNQNPFSIQDQQQQPPRSPQSLTTTASPIYNQYNNFPYTQGGNVNNANTNDRPGGNTYNQYHPTGAISAGTTHNYVTPDSSTPSFYQPRGTYDENLSAVEGRGKGHQHHSSSSSPSSVSSGYADTETTHHKPTGQSSTATTTQSYETEYEPKLYRVSDKIGVPLYILSPEVDPLLKNIESDNYYKIN